MKRMSRNKVLTDKYYDFIVEFSARNGRTPTLDEIRTGLGIRSKSTAHHHISNLVGAGKLTKDENGHLGLVGYRFVLVEEAVAR